MGLPWCLGEWEGWKGEVVFHDGELERWRSLDLEKTVMFVFLLEN